MAAIRSSGNATTELRLIKFFRTNGISGWKRNNKGITGRPDFIFLNNRTAVFVDGCFWHNCQKHAKLPLTNRPFWSQKLAFNKKRDLVVNKTLKQQGWKVVRIWEHETGKFSQKLAKKFNR